MRVILVSYHKERGHQSLVSVITCTIREEYMENVFENFSRQHSETKELIVILNKDSMNINDWLEKAESYRNVSIYQLPQNTTLGECLNFGIKLAKHPYIAKFDDDDYYSPYYLSQQIEALEKTDAAIVGKSTSFIYFEGSESLNLFYPGFEDRYVTFIRGATLTFRKELWEECHFTNVNTGEDSEFLSYCLKKGYKIYATNRYNFVNNRRADANSHSITSIHNYVNHSTEICKTDDYRPLVTKSS
ncbi:glycosyltransferase [Rossellomorea vietnamensis]|uniref:Glycosyltransferase n=1 Tax=Rossellomorea vietnamensis TaxID=218284 RepID=A0A5D4M8J9_9BACI|nr:glycosyltransferase [Rossellomorea vietnamensis]TYR97936.1 glycosyltransferase [Rossellomorea vietnamensis]